ncbi:MFS transporter [Streptomyces sp. NBC_00878]|uniref:MFS transporter n=1 Tax=Streptomyces sp. NBC_00878 TaxID=2975854 RepID=UPI00224EDFB6|nr:MFS transporter [Streptomyces sp. NBC_00878]MCX4911704.1 MFS transporter [Streptomyces sp. NBC_00878]
MNLRERIDTSPMSGYQWLIIALCVVLNALDGYDVLAMAFTAPGVGSEFHLDGGELGLLLSAGLMGMAAGSLLLAPFADLFGRRPLILLSVGLATAGMLLSATSGSATQLALWRVLTGLGVGGILACTTVIASEYASRRWRGLAIALYTAGYGIGATVGGLVAVTLQSSQGWRSVFLLGGVLTGVVLLLLAALLPESVQFLLTRQPRNALARVNTIATRIRQEPLTSLQGMADAARPTASNRVGDLFTAAHRRYTLLLWVAFFTLMFGFYFVNSWTPTLLVSAGLTEKQSVTVGIMLALGGTVGAILYGLLTSRWDSRRILIGFAVLSGVAMALFISATATLALAFAFGIAIGMLVNGCMAGLYTLAPSMYETQVRSTGVGWAIGIGRGGAILAPIAAGALLDAGWTAGTLYLAVGTLMLVCAACVALSRPRSATGVAVAAGV